MPGAQVFKDWLIKEAPLSSLQETAVYRARFPVKLSQYSYMPSESIHTP
jgi:hypothetical protein